MQAATALTSSACAPLQSVTLRSRPVLRPTAPFQRPHRGVARVMAQLDTSSSASPARQAISGLVSTIYKATASLSKPDETLPPLWQSLLKLDLAGVQSALRSGQDPNGRNVSTNETPLLHIAREGHYKYPPLEIPALLIQSGADLDAKDSDGRTGLQVSLLSGWQNIAELLLRNGASTDGVAAIKDKVTCPDCKRIIAQYNL